MRKELESKFPVILGDLRSTRTVGYRWLRERRSLCKTSTGHRCCKVRDRIRHPYVFILSQKQTGVTCLPDDSLLNVNWCSRLYLPFTTQPLTYRTILYRYFLVSSGPLNLYPVPSLGSLPLREIGLSPAFFKQSSCLPLPSRSFCLVPVPIHRSCYNTKDSIHLLTYNIRPTKILVRNLL